VLHSFSIGNHRYVAEQLNPCLNVQFLTLDPGTINRKGPTEWRNSPSKKGNGEADFIDSKWENREALPSGIRSRALARYLPIGSRLVLYCAVDLDHLPTGRRQSSIDYPGDHKLRVNILTWQGVLRMVFLRLEDGSGFSKNGAYPWLSLGGFP
jgi:hypothetical protein